MLHTSIGIGTGITRGQYNWIPYWIMFGALLGIVLTLICMYVYIYMYIKSKYCLHDMCAVGSKQLPYKPDTTADNCNVDNALPRHFTTTVMLRVK